MVPREPTLEIRRWGPRSSGGRDPPSGYPTPPSIPCSYGAADRVSDPTKARVTDRHGHRLRRVRRQDDLPAGEQPLREVAAQTLGVRYRPLPLVEPSRPGQQPAGTHSQTLLRHRAFEAISAASRALGLARWFDEVVLIGQDDQLCAVAGAQLGHRAADVGLRGGMADGE
jgi:hypothetical protein